MRRALLAAAVMPFLVVGCRAGALVGRAAPGLAVPPPAGKPAASFELPPLTERVLPNGLTVLVAEYHELPLVVFHLVVPGGAAHDPPGREGVAELTAELMRQGTERRGAEELAREIEFLGGNLGASAGFDFSSVYGEFLAKDLNQGLDLFADVVLRPAFRTDEFRRARELTLAGIVAARENPGSVAERCFQSYLYGSHPYGHAVAGSEDSVRRLTAADVRAFYRGNWGPRGAVLAVVGNAPAAELEAKAERAFGAWRPLAATPPPPAPPVRVSGRKLLLVDKPAATQTHIRIGNVAIARNDPTYVPAVVTGTILGGGFGSRLIEELRVKRSLTYGASSSFSARRAPGDFRVGTFTKVETTGEALAVTLDLLAQFAAEGATAEELARAQSLLTGHYPLQMETPGALAGRLTEVRVYDLPTSDIETYPGRVLEVSGEDVRRIAARHVSMADAAIVVVGPADKLASQLAPFGRFERTMPEACDAPGGPSAVR